MTEIDRDATRTESIAAASSGVSRHEPAAVSDLLANEQEQSDIELDDTDVPQAIHVSDPAIDTTRTQAVALTPVSADEHQLAAVCDLPVSELDQGERGAEAIREPQDIH